MSAAVPIGAIEPISHGIASPGVHAANCASAMAARPISNTWPSTGVSPADASIAQMARAPSKPCLVTLTLTRSAAPRRITFIASSAVATMSSVITGIADVAAHFGEPEDVVARHRLLHVLGSIALDRAREADRVGRDVVVVGVDAQRHRLADRLAHGGDAIDVARRPFRRP